MVNSLLLSSEYCLEYSKSSAWNATEELLLENLYVFA